MNMYFYLTYNSMNISYIIVLILIIINHNTNNIYENIKYIKYNFMKYTQIIKQTNTELFYKLYIILQMDKDIKNINSNSNTITCKNNEFIEKDEAILYENNSVEIKREYNNEEILGFGTLFITSK